MSKKTIKQVKTIIFICIGFVLLSLSIFIIGHNQNVFYSTVQYKAKFDSAQGLFVGSVVTVNGIQAGNVRALEIEDDGIVVTIGVRKNFIQYVNQTSIAHVNTKGLVGDKYISINTKESGVPIPEGNFIPSSISSELLGIFSEQGEFAKSASAFLKEAAVFLSNINNKKDQSRFLKKLDKVTTQTQKFLSDDKNKDLKEILTHTKSILKKIDRGQGTLGALVNDQTVHDKALSFLGGKPYKFFLRSLFKRKKENSVEEAINPQEDF